MDMAAAASISASESVNGTRSLRASSDPMAVLPAPIIPISTIWRVSTCVIRPPVNRVTE